METQAPGKMRNGGHENEDMSATQAAVAQDGTQNLFAGESRHEFIEQHHQRLSARAEDSQSFVAIARFLDDIPFLTSDVKGVIEDEPYRLPSRLVVINNQQRYRCLLYYGRHSCCE